jgi:hypothetical protein
LLRLTGYPEITGKTFDDVLAEADRLVSLKEMEKHPEHFPKGKRSER